MDIRVDFKGFGQQVRKSRKELGLTQAELAEITGLSANYISHIEHASRISSLHTLVSLSYALDISPNDLLEDSLPDNLFRDSDIPFKLREARCTLANTLSNWVLADLPDIHGQPDAPVDLALLPPLRFMTLEECAALQATSIN